MIIRMIFNAAGDMTNLGKFSDSAAADSWEAANSKSFPKNYTKTDEDITAAENTRAGNKFVQHRLNALAIKWGYDDMTSLVSYKLSSNPQWALEASVASDWRDATWMATHAYAAQHPMDGTPDGLMAALPQEPDRPTA